MLHVVMVYELTDVTLGNAEHSQTAGWNEVAKGKFPNVFGTGYTFGGPTYFQGKTHSDALRNAVNSATAVHPRDWK